MSHLDDHVRAWLRAVGRLPGGRTGERGDVLWARAGIEWPLFNGATGADPAGMETALADLRSHGRPFFWWGGDARGQALRDAGMVAVDQRMPWMQARRAALPEAQLPSGVRLDEVYDEAGHRTWARTLREVHALPVEGEQAWLESGRLAGWDRLPWRMWTASDDNDPIGVSLLFCGGGVASLVGVGVTPDHRRRGIGRALTLVALHEASEDIAGFFATSEGTALYRSLGFASRGSLTRWMWEPPTRFTLRRGSSGTVRAG